MKTVKVSASSLSSWDKVLIDWKVKIYIEDINDIVLENKSFDNVYEIIISLGCWCCSNTENFETLVFEKIENENGLHDRKAV